jgi:pyrroline-5-carboxylate reductase
MMNAKHDDYHSTELPMISASSRLKHPEADSIIPHMLSDRTIGFIGAGNMAEALIAGLLHANRLAPGRLLASDIDESRLTRLQHTYKIRTAPSNAAAAREADILVLAVEPQILDEVLAEMAGSVRADTLVVSVAAGYPISRIARRLSAVRGIVRSMPNTPSLVREGVSAVAYEDRLSALDADAARTLFESIGQVIRVEERWLDAVTGLSGSGPAYVYVMIEALADGGVKMGLPRETAQLLAAQTVSGAARLVLESHQHPGVLKDRVASPGGTSMAGLHELERGGLRAALISAVEAAAQRSQELGTVL